MDSRSCSSPGLCTPFILMLLQLPISAIAELTTSILLPSTVLELRQATPTNNGSSPTSSNSSTHQNGEDDDGSGDNDSSHVFNYYFLLIAITIAILLLGFIFAGRRRKRKTMQLLNTRQEALRRDLEGWPRGRPGPSGVNSGQSSRWVAGARNWRSRNPNDTGVMRHDEGLDDLGEAPPPYNPGDKPPSIAVGRHAAHEGEAVGSEAGLSVPLRTLARNNTEHNPPGYLESISNNGSEESGQIARLDAVITPTTDRFESARRLLDGTENSSH